MTENHLELKADDDIRIDRNNPFEALIKRLDLMIRAHYSLLYIVGTEEEPVEAVIAQVALQVTPARRVLFWDIVRGWEDNGSGKGSVMAALDRIGKTAVEEYTIFVLRDLHPILKYPYTEKNVPVIRELRNLTRELKHSKKTIVLTSNVLELPAELKEEVTVIDFPLPNVQEIEHLISQVLTNPEQLQVTGLAKEQLVKAFQGLSRAKIGRILATALAAKEQINESDIDKILEEKQQAICETGILDFFNYQESLKSMGGLENLKLWIKMRQDAFTDEARCYGLPNPKGILLVGVQGTGKSLSAKIIASEWRLPLLRLDIGRLFGGVVGESESRVRQMIELAEAIAPCVLWIDQIDQVFANTVTGADGDSGTSCPVFGSLITWMQEKTSPVFIVATANNLQGLPAQLLRKGRFDEIFFLDLPSELERQDIFQVHLQRLRSAIWQQFDLGILAQRTENFSGAEIEQVVIDGLYRAFGTLVNGQRRDLTTEDILRSIEDTVPLAAIARSQIEDLKRWATQAGAKTASK
ncbi:AAA family ATPase [Tychonema sp. BBK16]|uniref:AAA family ATPase n=1 Tax=Tychonema sp. BBK16 TaxID=2699888 RepID=UPI001F418E46|nr:AAA family ATPase [Tychonema sp. BBK16]MCF6372185.1 AAA family ATPase [Tychonema sp. BBK16]